MAYDPTRPADTDLVKKSAELIRENFEGLRNDGIVLAKPPLYGDGAPAANVGQTGESYIDARTGNQYLKNISGQWEAKLSLDNIISNTIGDTIDYSLNNTVNELVNNTKNELVSTGIVIPKPSLYGDGVPAANIGQTNQLYIDIKTGNHYLKNSSGVWEVKLSLDSPVEKVQTLGNCSGSITISAANGNIVTLTVKGTLSINLNANTSGSYGRVLTLIMTNGGSYTITWPSSVRWARSMAPLLTATGTDIITFITTDNGAKWFGMLGGSAFV